MKIFGFEITNNKNKKSSSTSNSKDKILVQKKSDDNSLSPALVATRDEDGASIIHGGGGVGAGYNSYQYDINSGAIANSDDNNIQKYRNISSIPEVDYAIQDIINESIVSESDRPSVKLNTDNLKEGGETLHKKLNEEFDRVLSLLDFSSKGYDIFRRWYIDGKIYYQIIIDEKDHSKGIQSLRIIDPTQIKKVKEIEKTMDRSTGIETVSESREYFIFHTSGASQSGVKILPESISYTPSGLIDRSTKRVISYLHKAIRPANQLVMMENSLVIYRFSRAPERRIFYIDVGNLPKHQAESYVRSIMAQHKNKMVYNAVTGEIDDQRNHMSMMDDIWLPRKEGGRGTEVSTLSGGENLGEIDDILYFRKKLLQSLNVPISRMESDDSFSLGRASEISRDEVKFQKFIIRLRNKFADLFFDILSKQLRLKNIVSMDEWERIREKIFVHYNSDVYFAELKRGEILSNRFDMFSNVESFIGEHISKEWARKNILLMDKDEIEEMEKQMKKEAKEDGNSDGNDF